MNKGWEIWVNADTEGVVYPVDDTREHDLVGECWCKPWLDDSGAAEGILVHIHNSHDGREKEQQS